MYWWLELGEGHGGPRGTDRERPCPRGRPAQRRPQAQGTSGAGPGCGRASALRCAPRSPIDLLGAAAARRRQRRGARSGPNRLAEIPGAPESVEAFLRAHKPLLSAPRSLPLGRRAASAAPGSSLPSSPRADVAPCFLPPLVFPPPPRPSSPPLSALSSPRIASAPSGSFTLLDYGTLSRLSFLAVPFSPLSVPSLFSFLKSIFSVHTPHSHTPIPPGLLSFGLRWPKLVDTRGAVRGGVGVGEREVCVCPYLCRCVRPRPRPLPRPSPNLGSDVALLFDFSRVSFASRQSPGRPAGGAAHPRREGARGGAGAGAPAQRVLPRPSGPAAEGGAGRGDQG